MRFKKNVLLVQKVRRSYQDREAFNDDLLVDGLRVRVEHRLHHVCEAQLSAGIEHENSGKLCSYRSTTPRSKRKLDMTELHDNIGLR